MAQHSIRGHYDGVGIVLDEPSPLAVGQPVSVVIVESNTAVEQRPATRRQFAGFAKGMFEMSDDFNDPLDEFAEYR